MKRQRGPQEENWNWQVYERRHGRLPFEAEEVSDNQGHEEKPRSLRKGQGSTSQGRTKRVSFAKSPKRSVSKKRTESRGRKSTKAKKE